MGLVLASIFSAFDSNRKDVGHVYLMIASLWVMTVLTLIKVMGVEREKCEVHKRHVDIGRSDEGTV